jgi:trigger factor
MIKLYRRKKMKKNYTVKLEGKEWTKCLDDAFNKKKKDIKIDGFRKGSVTKELYIKKFGIESLYMDAVDIALPILYDKLLSDKNTITPASSPAVDIKHICEDCLDVEFTIVSAPEVKLGKYTNLKINKDKAEITDHDIDHEIEHLREQFTELKLIEENDSIKNGHVVQLDFEGLIDNKPFDGGKAENYSLTIGSNTFIPGFEDALIGMKINEKKDIKLKFPENYHAADLKNKDVIFKVKINDIKEKILPEINDDFFKDLGIEGIDTLDKLKVEIKANLEVQKDKTIEDEYTIKCLDEAVKNAKFDIPEEMTNDEIERMIKTFSNQLSMQGMNLDKYLEFTNSKLEDLKGQMKDEANKRISYRLIIDAVAKKENIEVTDKEIDEEIEIMCKNYGMEKEELLKSIGGREVIKYDVQNKKAVKLITE